MPARGRHQSQGNWQVLTALPTRAEVVAAIWAVTPSGVQLQRAGQRLLHSMPRTPQYSCASEFTS